MAGEKDKDDLAKMEQAVADIRKEFETAKTANAAKVTELETALKAATDALAIAKAEAETAKSVASLSDAEKAWYDNLKPKGDKEKDKTDCEDAKKAFLAMKSADRDTLIKRAADELAKGDETIEVSGQTISKRAVGDSLFAVMKAQNATLVANTAAIAKAQDEAVTARIEKRVDDAVDVAPGTKAEKVALLKAVEKAGFDEKVMKTFNDILETCNKLTKSGFAPLGHDGKSNPVDIAKAKEGKKPFEAKVAEIQKGAPNMSAKDALEKARKDHPDEFKAYQEAGRLQQN